MLVWIALIAAAPQAAPDPALQRRVAHVLAKAPVIDGHNDLPWEIREKYDAKPESVDLTRDTAALPLPLQTDIPRLRKGGVGGQFWSVYIPASSTGPRGVEMTLEEIDIVRRFVAANRQTFEMATTAADVRRIVNAGRIASLLGIEGGHQIDGRLSVLRQMRALGVGYMTLTHGKSLDWADSSTDAPRANGLSEFGRKVVAEMNRIGMLVDVSHVSDATMAAALDVSKAPVIASHSSARAIAERPRNISDDLLARIGHAGGVVMVNFYPAFLSADWNDWDNQRSDYAKAQGVAADGHGDKASVVLAEWDRTHPMPRVDVTTVADHIEHIARIAGKGAVGFGGDYDGIGGAGPEGMKGVDSYPLVLAELARRGWSDAELGGLTSGNVLRVMEAAERVSKNMAGQPPIDATEPD